MLAAAAPGEPVGPPRGLRRLGLLAALLALLAVVLATPGHVLESVNDAASAAATVQAPAKAQARPLIDHTAPGHDCATHCAAHILGLPPGIISLVGRGLRRIAWTWPQPSSPPPTPTHLPQRPPRT